ncbi:alpha/beta hydrolase [Bacillaceae bacterium S4-13-58]
MKVYSAEYAKGTVVIVHGAFEHSGRYDAVAKRFTQEGYHVVTGDLPGQGKTDGERGHIDSFTQYLDTIEKWVHKAEEFKLPIYALGHSMGGLAVSRTLQEKSLPITAVILSSPCIGIVDEPSKGVQAFSKICNVIAPTLLVSGNLNPLHVTRNEEVRERDLNDSLIVQKISVRWFSELQNAMLQVQEKVQQYPNIPTLVMQAGDDKLVRKEVVHQWYKQLPVTNKKYKEWEGLYHEILFEPEGEEVFQMALSFIK